jgi:hypothetical protein
MRVATLRPMIGMLFLGGVCAGAATAAPQASGSASVPPSLMSAAECMARTLRSMPGVTGVEITPMPTEGSAYPVLAYAFGDASGRRRFTEISLFEITGIDDAPYVFDRADVQNDPVAERLLPVWKAQCRAGLGYITSVPR